MLSVRSVVTHEELYPYIANVHGINVERKLITVKENQESERSIITSRVRGVRKRQVSHVYTCNLS